MLPGNQLQKYALPLSFIGTACLLTLFGILMIYNAGSFGFARSQMIWFVIALTVCGVSSSIDYKFWKKFAIPLYAISAILLIAVLVPGVGDTSYGAQRWIRVNYVPILGSVGFQPAEITKIAMIIFFAAWFSKKGRNKNSKSLVGFLVTFGLIVALIMSQPDLGTTLIIISAVGVIYYLAREPLKYILGLGALVIVGVLILIAIAPYRLERFQTYIHFWKDPFDTPDQLGSTYHIRQAIIAIGSGGIFGLGPGQSRQKYGYVPFPETDSIFSIIAEEFGLFGVTILFLGFIFFLRQGFTIADRADEEFGRLLAAGCMTWFAVQIVLNVGAMSVLIPFTGVPLLFISYGGSALVVGFFAVGILVNIAWQNRYNQGIQTTKKKKI